MKHEINQFLRAIKAKTTLDDEKFIRQYLTHQEQILFFRQRISDQRHALDTAAFILNDIAGTAWIDVNRIVKMALLHDVGKINVFMPLWVRPTAVILKKTLPWLFHWIVKKGALENTKPLFKYLYSYECHPSLGEKFLKEIGTEKEVITLVRMHHDLPCTNEPKELPIFRRADNQ